MALCDANPGPLYNSHTGCYTVAATGLLVPPWAANDYPTTTANNTVWYGDPPCNVYIAQGFYGGPSGCADCQNRPAKSLTAACQASHAAPCDGQTATPETTMLMECCLNETVVGSLCPSTTSFPSIPNIRGHSRSSCSLASNTATISPLSVSGNNCTLIQQAFTITDNDGLKAISYNGLAAGATLAGSFMLGDKSATVDYFWPSPQLRTNSILSFAVQDLCDNVTYLSVLFNVVDATPCSSSSAYVGGPYDLYTIKLCSPTPDLGNYLNGPAKAQSSIAGYSIGDVVKSWNMTHTAPVTYCGEVVAVTRGSSFPAYWNYEITGLASNCSDCLSSGGSGAPDGGGGGSGTDILVQDCTVSGTVGQYYCSDPSGVSPMVGGVVLLNSLGGGGPYYCGTVISLTAVGAPTHQLDANFTDCNSCAPYSGGGP
jgi:hypothetical protein